VKAKVNPLNDHMPKSQLVVVENTCNKGGGSYYDINELKRIKEVCDEYGLKYHLDGARLFNALVETEESPKAYG
ncbi:MAG: beta-eliminating lyase-related protein, partial [Flavobacteriales bacterium]